MTKYYSNTYSKLYFLLKKNQIQVFRFFLHETGDFFTKI
jgi:hypothetical protein